MLARLHGHAVARLPRCVRTLAGPPAVAAAAPAAAPANLTLVGTPLEVLAQAAETGVARLARDANTAFTHAALGAVFLSCSTCLYLNTLAGTPELRASSPGLHALLGGLVFPSGLAMIIFNGADLLTANFYYGSVLGLVRAQGGGGAAAPAAGAAAVGAAAAGAPAGASVARAAARVLAQSCAGNVAGSLAMAGGVATVLFPRGSPPAEYARALAERKARLGAPTAFGKAVAANFLVCTAVFMASASRTAGGKLAALWLPISLFVTLGLEHSVMNYFLLPLGMLSGADVSVAEAVLGNLVPVTLGNAVGALALARLQLPPAAARAVAQRLARGH
jgi:formate/nitrite transporter FocA (FNT family)